MEALMNSDIVAAISQLDLKVLIDFDETYHVYAARCLETGATASATTADEAQSLIKETLELDILLAARANSLTGLFHVCAAPEVWARWYESKAAFPNDSEKVNLEIKLDPPKRGVLSEFTIVKARDHSAA
jgi:hypothetical protein